MYNSSDNYVSFDLAKTLDKLGYDGEYEYMYATENFCVGDNPISFTTISIGERILDAVAYYVNDKNEDAYYGIACPTLWQVQKWLRDKKNCIVLVIPGVQDDWITDWITDWVTDMYGYIVVIKGQLPKRIRIDNFSDSYESTLREAISIAITKLNDR